MYGRNLQTSPQRFLEEVRLYPFLYDKTQPNYKDKEEKMNRWELIGALFGLTSELSRSLHVETECTVCNSLDRGGMQAMLKFAISQHD